MADVVKYRFVWRGRTAANWTALNEVLLEKEAGIELDTMPRKWKIGDGVTPWNDLPYQNDQLSVQALTSSATITPNATDDLVVVSELAVNAAIANPSGTLSEGQGFLLRLKDNGTSRNLTWGTKYRAVGGTLPSATVVGEWAYFPCSYNAVDDKWDVFFDQTGTDGLEVQTVVSSSTVTPVTTNDLVVISAQAASLTIANPSGAATDGIGFVIRLKDNGSSRSIAFGTNYQAMGAALPTATTVGKWIYIPIVYNASDAKWDVLPSTVQQ